MLIKFLLILILIPIQSFALTRFPGGTCRLEGFLVKATNEANWYFIINHRTQSETRFRLTAFVPSAQVSEKGQHVQVLLTIPHETFSLYGEAELKIIERFINPYTDSKRYGLEAEVQSACMSDRYPNSSKNIKKKK